MSNSIHLRGLWGILACKTIRDEYPEGLFDVVDMDYEIKKSIVVRQTTNTFSEKYWYCTRRQHIWVPELEMLLTHLEKLRDRNINLLVMTPLVQIEDGSEEQWLFFI